MWLPCADGSCRSWNMLTNYVKTDRSQCKIDRNNFQNWPQWNRVLLAFYTQNTVRWPSVKCVEIVGGRDSTPDPSRELIRRSLRINIYRPWVIFWLWRRFAVRRLRRLYRTRPPPQIDLMNFLIPCTLCSKSTPYCFWNNWTPLLTPAFTGHKSAQSDHNRCNGSSDCKQRFAWLTDVPDDSSTSWRSDSSQVTSYSVTTLTRVVVYMSWRWQP
jgi:hypothetical protein